MPRTIFARAALMSERAPGASRAAFGRVVLRIVPAGPEVTFDTVGHSASIHFGTAASVDFVEAGRIETHRSVVAPQRARGGRADTSRRGNRYDNAVMEAFFWSVK